MQAPREDLAALLAQFQHRSASDDRSLKRTQQTVLCQKANNKELRDEIATLREELAEARAQTTYKAGVRYVSIQGGFNLALRRSIAHAGALATAKMLTAKDGKGTVATKNPVISFEYKAACAKVLRSEQFHSAPLAEVVDIEEASPVPAHATVECGFHLIKMDATNSEAIQKSKIHVAVVTSLRANLGCVASMGDGAFDLPMLSSQCCQMVQAAQLLEVQHSTGAETCEYALKHLEGVQWAVRLGRSLRRDWGPRP